MRDGDKSRALGGRKVAAARAEWAGAQPGGVAAERDGRGELRPGQLYERDKPNELVAALGR
jgi:hypothetical protein